MDEVAEIVTKKLKKYDPMIKRPALSYRIGRLGEDIVGVPPELFTIKVNGRIRHPDWIKRKVREIIEVKNVKRLHFTRQLRDMYQYSTETGFKFVLYVRRSSEIRGRLKSLVKDKKNNVEVYRGLYAVITEDTTMGKKKDGWGDDWKDQWDLPVEKVNGEEGFVIEVIKSLPDAIRNTNSDRMETDPEFRKRVEENTRQEKIILKDVLSVGYLTPSLTDMMYSRKPYPRAIPVLMKHLQKGIYNNDITECLIHTLKKKYARGVADELIMKLYKEWISQEPDDSMKYTLCDTLAYVAGPRVLEELMRVVRDKKHGDTRQYLLPAIRRLLGRKRRDEMIELLKELSDDPEIGEKSKHLLNIMLRPRKKRKNSASKKKGK